ncbi:glycosyl hydrolase [Massilibacteroides sp.]|uniref:glycosyl hydrolase n=1 Tax=Massilibacteroides sp. TaxID=2034766 RepID=UPI002613F09D|nr:glycosyl hydrolase [Massilibacteroides sp.]MDD4513988.1 glycosyl hydrolase [Massilibacteroides sp.]
MKIETLRFVLLSVLCCFLFVDASGQKAGLPSVVELNKPFGEKDKTAFRSPAKVHYPETWFHYIGGNVSLPGITADLENIAAAGISGVQLFHGQFGGAWPGVDPQIACLSPLWDNAVKYTAEECRRLGLRFTMQNCPGWAMSGGPWIKPSNAMRHLTFSRTDIRSQSSVQLSLPVPALAADDWRDYKDIVVLAFPTPLDDSGDVLKPSVIDSNRDLNWEECLGGDLKTPLKLAPTTSSDPHWIDVTFPESVKVRTLELPSINSFNHGWCYEPGVTVTMQALLPDGTTRTVLHSDVPSGSWQDDFPMSIACPEVEGVTKYRISIVNKHDLSLKSLRLFSAARKNNWESEAGWTLRGFERTGEHVNQSLEAYLRADQIYDISDNMSDDGTLKWQPPFTGKWTVLRVGHINTGQKNAPAPPEGTGWECDKLSEEGPNVHFAGYIGRLTGGVLQNGLLKGMLLDSWECKTQTWTTNMEQVFEDKSGYPLREWLPAVFGYVVKDPETTARFLLDWRSTIGDLFANKFYGRMSELAKENNLTISYETAAGDVFPADILEYFKYADIPMCEFWHPLGENYVGSLNFKPIKPTTSAARLYGKPRVSAEAFTSFNLTWDERWEMLKEVANVNMAQGVTHLVFHTYTHNPRTDFLPPGTSFGSSIGTPFLRGQTWWKYMPEFTGWLSRCSYLLERGKPVSDVLWYLGDEISHKPDQDAPFPQGFKYDYCNPDVLLNRLSVQNGMLVTPEGVSYKVLWIPDNERMRPETLEKIYSLIQEGATVVGNAPKGLATLIGGDTSQKRFDAAVKNIWGSSQKKEIQHLGKGKLVSGLDLDTALSKLGILPDVVGGNALWLHRQTDGADWYFVASPQGEGFKGTLDFRCVGQVDLWDPVTGDITPVKGARKGDYTSVSLVLPKAGSCFLVFTPNKKEREIPEFDTEKTLLQDMQWTLSFPQGWGAPASLQITSLQPWKDLDLSAEGKAFSGTVTYSTTFDLKTVKPEMKFVLDLGDVSMIASVSVNGTHLRTLWASPYKLDLTDAIKKGQNTLMIEVTSTWFNRLVYDAGQLEDKRKTWTINGPGKDASLKDYGLLGPVTLSVKSKRK